MKLIFSHIPKTAGTSVRAFLSKNMRQSLADFRSVVAYAVGGVVSPVDFPAYPLPTDWNFLVGHVTLANLLKNPGVEGTSDDIVFLSFVRDPVDRLLSLANYVYTTPVHPDHERAQRIGVDKFLLGMAENATNVQCRYLQAPDPAPDWTFRIATVRDTDSVCREVIQTVTGAPAQEGPVSRLNVSADRSGNFSGFSPLTKDNVSNEVIARIREKNRHDIALFKEVEEAGVLHRLPTAAQLRNV